jgi:predicted HD superfamily hydrolase involved in NAD metabolism
MNLVEMDEILKNELKPGRYIHSVNTMMEAVSLAEHYGENKETAAVAGLLHDCAKQLSDSETLEYCKANGIEPGIVEKSQVFLLHGTVGAIIAKEKYGIRDEVILNAIRYHTTGCAEMSMMDKIIYLADYIEPGRTHSGVENVKKLAYVDINKALICAFNNVIEFVIEQNGLIHQLTVEARNSILING